jgi:hypothetical protein
MKENSVKMTKAVNEWQHSSMSVTQYCEIHKINRAAFYYWRKKLLNPIEEDKSTKFQVIQSPMAVNAIEYIHPGGHRVLFYQPVDASFLKNLMS